VIADDIYEVREVAKYEKMVKNKSFASRERSTVHVN